MKNILKKVIDAPLNGSNGNGHAVLNGDGHGKNGGAINGVHNNGNYGVKVDGRLKNLTQITNFKGDDSVKRQNDSKITLMKKIKHKIDKGRDWLAERCLKLSKKLPISFRKLYAIPLVVFAYTISTDNFRKNGLAKETESDLTDFTDIKNIAQEINSVTDFIENATLNKSDLDEIKLFEKVLVLATQLTGFTGAGLWRYQEDTKVISLVAFVNHPNAIVEPIQDFVPQASIISGLLDTACTKQKYEKLKPNQGFVKQAIFENKKFIAEDISKLPQDVSISSTEKFVLAHFDPDSGVVFPFGYDNSKGYAMGAMTFAYDKTIATSKNINVKSLALDAFCQLSANLISYFRFIKSERYINGASQSSMNFEIMREEQVYKLAITKSLQNLYATKVMEVLNEKQLIESEKNNIEKNLKITVGKQAYKALRSTSDIEELIENSTSKYAAILFADIKNFTRKSENLFKKYGMELGSAKLFKFLNGFNSAINPSISSFGGQIDKFLGDGLMVSLVAEENKTSQSDGEVAALGSFMAKKMFHDLDTLESDFTSPLIKELHAIGEPLNMRIGLNTGLCAFGALGYKDNINPENSRIEHTAISKVVNQAARHESKAPTNNIMYGKDTYEKLKDLYISENETPVLWSTIFNDPFLKRTYGKILLLSGRAKYYDLLLKTFETHSVIDGFKLYDGVGISDLVTHKAQELKGLGINDTYVEKWDFVSPLKTLQRFYYYHSIRNSNRKLFMNGITELLHSIRQDSFAIKLLQDYIDDQILAKGKNKIRLKEGHRFDVSNDYLKPQDYWSQKLDEAGEKVDAKFERYSKNLFEIINTDDEITIPLLFINKT